MVFPALRVASTGARSRTPDPTRSRAANVAISLSCPTPILRQIPVEARSGAANEPQASAKRRRTPTSRSAGRSGSLVPGSPAERSWCGSHSGKGERRRETRSRNQSCIACRQNHASLLDFLFLTRGSLVVDLFRPDNCWMRLYFSGVFTGLLKGPAKVKDSRKNHAPPCDEPPSPMGFASRRCARDPGNGDTHPHCSSRRHSPRRRVRRRPAPPERYRSR